MITHPYSASSSPRLTEYHYAVLRYISECDRKVSEVINEFKSPLLDRSQIKGLLLDLKQCGYIKPVELLSGMAYIISADESEDTPMETEPGYQITSLGNNRITGTSSGTTYSNISNSNIAHQSQNTNQTINITALPQDIQEKIQELELAVAKRDSSAIKKAFGYIADKSVDVAIAIATGALLR